MTTPSVHDLPFLVAATTTLLPLAAFVVIALVTRRRPRLSAGLSLAAATGTLAGALVLFLWQRGTTEPVEYGVRWFATEGLTVTFGLLLDPLSVHMLAVVAVISFLVQIYSVGFMRGDPGYARYFAFLSLFVWAMTLLTLSSSLLQLYVFWELVGLASYLLIGFWYEKWSATAAGKKAFLMTRVGDVAFFLGIVLVLQGLGTLSIRDLDTPGLAAALPAGRITAAALLLFVGIIGKSAQFPLMTWLPDAMEGPTPVSALLHSATMVAAGVYLFARLFAFFSLSATAMTVCLAVGTLSMLLASTMALVSRDLKEIWAYSTISQLGYMIMGLAAGNLFAGVFHLTTHAAFKALLFLCSGVLLQRLDTHDIYELSERGARTSRPAMVCLSLAAATLAGLPPLSGFFSKERILGALAGLDNPVWLAAGLAGVFLTAYYAFRPVWLLLFPTARETPREPPAASRGERWMVGPLVVLAGLAAALGFSEGSLSAFLGVAPHEVVPPAPGWLTPVSVAAAVSGVALAWAEFGREGAPRLGFAERVSSVRALFANRWYLDRLYELLVSRVVDRGLAPACAAGDKRVIDGAILGFAHGLRGAGGLLSRLYAVGVQRRLATVFAVTVLLLLFLI